MSTKTKKAEVINNTATPSNARFIVKVGESSMYFYQSTDDTNCKLSYLHNLGNINYFKTDEDKKTAINAMLERCKGAVLFNTIYKEAADWLAKHYPVYYYNKVPIGYNKGYQYHILIKNEIARNVSCLDPKVKVTTPLDQSFTHSIITDNGNVDTKETIASKLKLFLKSKRRKDDYVDEFVKSLNLVEVK